MKLKNRKIKKKKLKLASIALMKKKWKNEKKSEKTSVVVRILLVGHWIFCLISTE